MYYLQWYLDLYKIEGDYMTDTVTLPNNESPSKLLTIRSSVKNIKKKIGNVINKVRQRVKPLEDITKPVVELYVFSIERNIDNTDRWLNKKLWIRNNQIHFHNKTTLDGADEDSWDDYYANTSEIAVLGFQVETASIYGRKMELSILEYKDLIWNSISTGDFIMVRTYLEGDEDDYIFEFDNYIDGTMREKDILGAIEELDFSGIITTKSKSVASSEQFRVEAIDLVKVLQQLNISIGRSEITETDSEGKTEGSGFWKNDLGSLLVESYFSALGDADDSEIGDLDSKSDLQNPDKKYLFGQPKDFAVDNINTNTRQMFKQIYSVRLDNNSRGKRFVIYLNFMTPIVAIKLIVNHILDDIGFTNFVSVDFSDSISDYFIIAGELLKEHKDLPLINFTTYFYDQEITLDLKLNRFQLLFDVSNKLMFYNFNDVMLFEGLESGQIFKLLQKKAFFVHDDVTRIHKNIDNIDLNMGLYNVETNVRHGFKEHNSGANERIFESLSNFRYNNFFDTISESRVAIRSSKVARDAGGAYQSAVPVSQLIYYAYSLYNNTPVFNDVFKDNFENNNIKEFDSHNYLHSISQVTWFTSIFVRTDQSDKDFRFVIYPICTPFKYQNSPKHGKRGQGIYYNNTDALEMEFQQLELNSRILFISDEERVNVRDGDVGEYIILKANVNDDRDKTRIDIFGDQNLDISNYARDKYNILKVFSRETLYDSKTNQEYIEKFQPHVLRTFMGSDSKRHLILGGDLYPATVKTMITHRGDEAKNEGQRILLGSFVPYNMIKWDDDDDGKMDIELNRNLNPISFARGKLKNGIERDITGYSFLIDGAGTDSDFEVLPYKMVYTLDREDEGAGTTAEIVSKQYETNFVITGVKSYIELDRLKDGLQFLFNKNLIPDDIRNNIRFNISPFNVETFDYAPRRREYSIADMIRYINDILDQIIKDNNNKNRLPYEIWIQPDLGDVYANMKAFYINTFETNAIMPNTNQPKNVERCITLLRQITERPLLFTEDWSNKKIDLQSDKLWGETFSPEFMDTNDDTPSHLNFKKMHRGIQEILKWIYAFEVFVQDVLRRTYENGSLYLANEGYQKKEIGEYIKLIDNRERFHIIDDPTALTDLKKVISHVKALKFTPDINERTESRNEAQEKLFSNDQRAIYYSASNPAIATKPFAWFIWKTITYMGDSSGGGGGTSGYTQKVYLTRDGVNFTGFYDEKDFISALASQLNDRGYDIIVPQKIIGS